MTQFIFKRVLMPGLLFATLISFTAMAQEKITLQMAVDRALANNLTIKQAHVTESLGMADYDQSKNNLLPNVSAGPQASYNFGRSPNLATYAYTNKAFLYVTGTASVQITLFQGGQLRNQILQNKLLLDVDKSSTAKIKNDLVLSVVTDYLQILTNQDLVVAAKQQIDIANQTA